MEDFTDLINYAKKIAAETNKVIYELVSGNPKLLYDASLHLIKAGGKRLRPLATVLGGRLFGLKEDIGVRAGAAVELLHNFTLVHDDIMDKDEFRRGVPTVHKLWGEDIAILAGDLLFSKAFEALLKLTSYDIDYEAIIKALKELCWASVTVAEGQALDLSLSKLEYVELNDYIEMVYKKTAALFKASLCIGAILAGASNGELSKLADYAVNVGIAFQIRDDELGLVADEKKLGKPVYSDLREGKKTVLVIYALSRASEGERKFLLSVLGNDKATKDELRRAADLILSLGALDYSNKLASEYLKKGLEALSSVNEVDREAKNLLRKLALFVAERQY